MKRKKIISIEVAYAPYRLFVEKIIALATARMSTYICVANAHMTIESWRNPDFASVVNGANITTPDGMPLVVSLRLLYGIEQERVAGMDLMPDVIAEAEKRGLSIFFYGSTDEVLDEIIARVSREHSALKVAGRYSPPFRRIENEEDTEIIEKINGSGANIVMVALGCPKQEYWMARHKGKINAVMLGVGGAFPVYAGLQKRAPIWMQKSSLEWLHRFSQEPKRLFKRYFFTNSLFIALLLKELIRLRFLRVLSE